MRMRIAFTGGGTGGHVFPGIAVTEALNRRIDAEIFWIGSRNGIEKRILAAHGIPFIGIPAGKLRRYFSLRNFFDIFKTLAGFLHSFFILLSRRPLFLFSKGGYVSVPPVLAARLLKIPVITHESDFDPGLATKINARCAAKILVSYAETARFFTGRLRKKIVHTGNPVRAAILEGNSVLGKKLVGCAPDLPLVLVLGGSLGSRTINTLIAAIAPAITQKAFIVHQTGSVKNKADASAPRYLARPFFYEELPHILAASTLVICRAGANTLWELAAAGKPSLLIPLPALSSRGDQLRNATVFEGIGASVVMSEDTATPQALLASVENLLDNRERLLRMGQAAGKIYIDDARERIATEILALISKKKGRELLHGAD